MHSNIGIIEDQYNHILTFKFLNGEISMREDEYGGYALCPGCGAGKTTVVKELINIRWYEGILYAAFTIDEVNSMYKYIVENLVGRSTNPHTREILKTEDILVLHSDYTADGTDNNLWRHNPQEIANKKVVLCTHSKLLNEPLDLLVTAKFLNKRNLPRTYAAMRGITALPRQWILIDEIADAKNCLATIDKAPLYGLSEFTTTERRIDPVTRLAYTVDLGRCISVRRHNFYSDFCENLDRLANVCPSVNKIFSPETNELNKIKNEKIRDNLYFNFNTYINSSAERCRLLSGFTDLLDGEDGDPIKSHVILLDGTADLTLYNSKKFKLLNLSTARYDSQVNLSTFRFNIERNPKLDKSYNDPDKYMKDRFNDSIDELESIIRENNQTLIFCWKNLKPNSELDSIDDDKIADTASVIVNSNYSLPNHIITELESRGFKAGVNFSVEYYGSGRDKAINDYRNYDAVVLFGKYQVPSYVISEFNLMYKSDINLIDYYANRVIQAICRSRIRLHNGLPINVYMSNDWSREIVDLVKNYLNTGTVSLRTGVGQSELNYRYSELMRMGITPKKARQITLLSTLDIQIYNSIITGNIYNVKLSLNDVFNVIPMSRKKSDMYKKMEGWIKNYGVNLEVVYNP